MDIKRHIIARALYDATGHLLAQKNAGRKRCVGLITVFDQVAVDPSSLERGVNLYDSRFRDSLFTYTTLYQLAKSLTYTDAVYELSIVPSKTAYEIHDRHHNT